MKLRRFGIWILLGGLITVMSCSNDDEPTPPPESVLNVNDKTYDLTSAVYMDWGTGDCDECADMDVWLLSEGLSVTDSGFVGSGHLVLLDLNSSSTTEIAEGTYSWSVVRIPNTIVNYFVGTDCAGTCGFSDLGVSGSVIVKKDGSNYQFDFDISILNGGKATGTYYGPIEETSPFSIFVSG